MLKKSKIEIDYFKSQLHNFQILILTNLVYTLVLLVTDILWLRISCKGVKAYEGMIYKPHFKQNEN